MLESLRDRLIAGIGDAAKHGEISADGNGVPRMSGDSWYVLKKRIDTALAEAEARGKRQGLEWQPIETAPKDGMSIPCLSPQYDGPVMLSWFKQNGLSAWRDWDADIHHPTAWFRLPLAITSAETQKPETGESALTVSFQMSVSSEGHLRVSGIEPRGLILSSADHDALLADIGPAIRVLLKHSGKWPAGRSALAALEGGEQP